MSHSPLLNLPGPSAELLDDIGAAIGAARDFVTAFDPELVVAFSPDHYNGFFYKLMPPFCIGTAASGVGDYGSHAGPLAVPADIALDCAAAVLDAGVDVAISAGIDVDHGTTQPLQALFGDAASVPVIPVFINSVAIPLGPIARSRALGAAIGGFLAGLDRRVLLLASGGLSHDPPVPTLASAPAAARARIVDGEPMGPEGRTARQQQVVAAAAEFAAGAGSCRPLNPDWDAALLDLLDTGNLAAFDGWTNDRIAAEAGNSAHEVRTWVAAFAALATAGPYRTGNHYYRPAPELIAGFAIRTAVPV
ncbi:2,3-dihydroxyphenylpropionate/2,3-dihydroxicinnam ic acid 1,2-dioxygenase [Mycolicibacterium insubricum]|uniref:2,3-dihydroxyphenylpropionate/2,3-dihydroxicinnamic acid 1,2-dioxygenase n=1 Tax=Mycolicibacterium insubricum TaxID=444597 RepID=A0A1X0CXY3_9MYCO|nr:3-carboxyethylcatechol 2,3-dioxygenase [Mycolicibacterium insubricum]ORA65041.1 3-(2,3-dihydroxyphenyl)propionate dioxygenase [Mycolicibacterium insubricum]BBZ68100.1 2,3-dihydroxyphenylpropionate/2,3-dihydroxicinnam ic acid 1,2-dioxygenase [Mycolicibacterium insubricum]